MTRTPEPCPAAEPSGDAQAANLTAERARLDAAYRATRYLAECPEAPGGRLEIRIDALHPQLDAWLDRVGVSCWSYLSAENPGSQARSAADNAQRTASLRQWLETS